jgi:hypothetical protein
MNSTILWDLTSCNALKFNRRFGGTPAFNLSYSAYSTINKNMFLQDVG